MKPGKGYVPFLLDDGEPFQRGDSHWLLTGFFLTVTALEPAADGVELSMESAIEPSDRTDLGIWFSERRPCFTRGGQVVTLESPRLSHAKIAAADAPTIVAALLDLWRDRQAWTEVPSP